MNNLRLNTKNHYVVNKVNNVIEYKEKHDVIKKRNKQIDKL